jgi:hypothetical protein
VKGGYGSTSTPTGDASTYLADVALEWLPAHSISVRTAYTRSFGIDPVESVFVADTVSAGLKLKLADRILFRGSVRYDALAFKTVSSRDTVVIRADPELEGQFGRWLKVGVGYAFTARNSVDVELPDYSKSEAFVRLGVTY